MGKLRLALVVATFAIAFSAALALTSSRPAQAIIHEIIGAGCRFGGAEVVPPGQVGASNGRSFVRALQSTGVIASITATPTAVTVTFDLSKPASKYTSAGFDLVIPDAIAPGVALVLSPLPVPDPTFPAFVHCANLNP